LGQPERREKQQHGGSEYNACHVVEGLPVSRNQATIYIDKDATSSAGVNRTVQIRRFSTNSHGYEWLRTIVLGSVASCLLNSTDPLPRSVMTSFFGCGRYQLFAGLL
jgi:hypothetical protein